MFPLFDYILQTAGIKSRRALVIARDGVPIPKPWTGLFLLQNPWNYQEPCGLDESELLILPVACNAVSVLPSGTIATDLETPKKAIVTNTLGRMLKINQNLDLLYLDSDHTLEILSRTSFMDNSPAIICVTVTKENQTKIAEEIADEGYMPTLYLLGHLIALRDDVYSQVAPQF